MQSILKVIQAFHTARIVLYIGCTGPVTRSSIAYKIIVLRPLTTGTMPLTASNFAYSYRMVCNFTKNKQKYAKLSIHSLICILYHVMLLNHN